MVISAASKLLRHVDKQHKEKYQLFSCSVIPKSSLKHKHPSDFYFKGAIPKGIALQNPLGYHFKVS